MTRRERERQADLNESKNACDKALRAVSALRTDAIGELCQWADQRVRDLQPAYDSQSHAERTFWQAVVNLAMVPR